jgi:hypothetical protein
VLIPFLNGKNPGTMKITKKKIVNRIFSTRSYIHP